MNTLKQFAKAVLRPRLLAVCLSAMLLLTSTACTATKAATPDMGDQGMYPHSDTQRDTRATDAAADRLVRQAEQRRQQIKGPQDYVEQVKPGQKLQNQAENAGQSVKQATKRVERMTEKAANNAETATKQTAKNASQAAQQAAQNAADNTGKSLNNLKKNAADAVEQAKSAADQAT